MFIEIDDVVTKKHLALTEKKTPKIINIDGLFSLFLDCHLYDKGNYVV